MYYVYLLRDIKNKIYIGFTSNLRRRIREHQLGKVFTTRKMDKPQLIYYEAYSTKLLAIEREGQLKRFGSAYYGLIKRLGIEV